MIERLRKYRVFFLGLALLAAYWIWIQPTGRGYIEDLCQFEQGRQIMAENLARFGKPVFTTESFGQPTGLPVAFMPWSIEGSWIGAWFWNWDRDFPFTYAWLGLSLLVSYLGVGWILTRMKLHRDVAWGLATLVLVFHAPRHYKAWHHYEHLTQHWLTLTLFFDAWVWQRFWRERKVSLSFEAWRGFLMLATLNTAGYFWGAMILEWIVFRASLAWVAYSRARRGERTTFELDWRRAAIPSALGAALLALQLRWFLPLAAEASKLGFVSQPMGWFSSIWTVMRPLWLEPVWAVILRIWPSFPIPLTPLTYYETVTAAGWIYWVPAWIAIRHLKRKRGGPGVGTVLPFLILLVIGIEYVSIRPHWVQEFLRATVPFMAFFRVGSRWGLLFPQLLTILIALSWPELSAWFRARWAARTPRFTAWVSVFAIACALETHVLARPPEMLPALSDPMLTLLRHVREAPGTTVLDLPFCLAGGNEVCTGAKCPIYPAATAGACFHGWHDKRVFGLYESRLVPSQCAMYDPAPFASWFSAWHSKRCFSEPEWDEFCAYLDTRTEIGAVLVYPELWFRRDAPECEDGFLRHLGPALDEASFATTRTPGGVPADITRVRRYPGKCLAK